MPSGSTPAGGGDDEEEKAWDMIAMTAPRGSMENGVLTTNSAMAGFALGKMPWNSATMKTKRMQEDPTQS